MKKYETLLTKMAPEVREHAKRLADEIRAETPLRGLRRARNLSQQEVAEMLGVGQPAVSKVEGRQDVRLSTLYRFVEALDGELRIVAHFRDGEVPICQFHKGAAA